MKNFQISPTSKELNSNIQNKLDHKTKPTGSLGQLEEIAYKICQIQHTLEPELINPTILVFAGDHGLADEGVSAYPQSVTHQMVLNFLNGGAAINVFSRQHDIDLHIVDAGVKHQFESNDLLHNKKIGLGTKNSMIEPAMNEGEFLNCVENGMSLISEIKKTGCNVVGFGEMGIGNTSAASLLTSKLLDLPIERCVGPGTGLDSDGVKAKTSILGKVLEKYKSLTNQEFFISVAGFEMATMLGAMMAAAKYKMTLLIDGFIASAVFLQASKENHEILDYGIFCHQSGEAGHELILNSLNANPILNMSMRLGEGTGCALAYPLIKSSIGLMNQMASFETAGVDSKA